MCFIACISYYDYSKSQQAHCIASPVLIMWIYCGLVQRFLLFLLCTKALDFVAWHGRTSYLCAKQAEINQHNCVQGSGYLHVVGHRNLKQLGTKNWQLHYFTTWLPCRQVECLHDVLKQQQHCLFSPNITIFCKSSDIDKRAHCPHICTHQKTTTAKLAKCWQTSST